MEPNTVQLEQNYPNPFNPSTNISYTLQSTQFVSLSVFTITGRKILTLVNGLKSMGSYTVSFDASNLASGVYFYQMKAGNEQITRKMLLSK